MSFKKTIFLFVFFLPLFVFAQENYEIQVYGSPTVTKGFTMFELHSNYGINGLKDTLDGVLPTHHAFHETIEITHGFTSWFEVGFYQFTSINEGRNLAYVGNHLRPRVTAPAKWNWPVGASLSVEAGYQEKRYSSDSWSVEIRPIIDKTIGKWYFSLNPTIDYAFVGYSHNQGLGFAPNFKFSYQATSFMQLGLEYYNSMGPFNKFDSFNQQPHQVAMAFDFNFSPVWELNVGYVKGLTSSVENDIFKIILGRRIGKKTKLSKAEIDKPL
jgi:hypothetical protein